MNYKSFEDNESVWTPAVSIISATRNSLFTYNYFVLQGNQSIRNRELVRELYAPKKPDNITEEEWEKQ